jgi:hypothetical protein
MRRHFAVRFDRVREATWSLVGLVALASTLWTGAVVFVVYPNPAFRAAAARVLAATGGLVQSTLLTNLVGLGVVVAVLCWGGLRLRDVGIDPGGLPVAATATGLVWLAVQLVGVTVAVAAGRPVRVDPQWSTVGVGVVLGRLIAQLVASALEEEIVFRGLLLNQLYLKFAGNRDAPTTTPTVALALALVASQTAFALAHVPTRGIGPGLVWLFATGLFYALVYHRTGNLLVAVGVHSLQNFPTSAVAVGGYDRLLVVVATLALLAVWPRLEAIRRRD